MPEDMAKHIGGYAYYDFEVEKGGVIKKLEAKSLWGRLSNKQLQIFYTGFLRGQFVSPHRKYSGLCVRAFSPQRRQEVWPAASGKIS